MAAFGTTTTAIRFLTQGRPSTVPQYRKWAEDHGISYSKQMKKTGFVKKYTAWRHENPDEHWQKLRDRGYNTRLTDKYGNTITTTRTEDEDYHIDQFRKRLERLSRFEDKLKTPFMIPAAPVPPLTFHEFVSFEEDGMTYLDYAAETMAKRRRPFVEIDRNLAEFAVAQHGMTFCKADTVLVVPYIIDTRKKKEKGDRGTLLPIPELTPDARETDENVTKTLGTPPFAQDTAESEWLLDKPYYGANAEALADEIRACTEDLIMITVEHNGFYRGPPPRTTNGAKEGHPKHANSVVLNKRTGKAVYFEPHLETSEFVENQFMPYGEVQTCVANYLSRISPNFTIVDAPTVCPDTGVGPLQYDDSLCVSWAFYGAMCILLNPEIPVTTVTDSISIFDIARMYYVAFMFIPMTIQAGRRRSGIKETMYKAVDRKSVV